MKIYCGGASALTISKTMVAGVIATIYMGSYWTISYSHLTVINA